LFVISVSAISHYLHLDTAAKVIPLFILKDVDGF